MEGRTLALMDEGEYSRLLANLAGRSRILLAEILDHARERRPPGLCHIQHMNAEFLKTPL